MPPATLRQLVPMLLFCEAICSLSPGDSAAAGNTTITVLLPTSHATAAAGSALAPHLLWVLLQTIPAEAKAEDSTWPGLQLLHRGLSFLPCLTWKILV